MLQAGDLVKMCDVAEHVAAKEHETTVKQLLSDERQRVYIPLYQSHLPKLDEAGIIDYDKPRGIVRPGECLEQFRQYLDSAPLETDDAKGGCDRYERQRPVVCCYRRQPQPSPRACGGDTPASGLILGVIITALFMREMTAF